MSEPWIRWFSGAALAFLLCPAPPLAAQQAPAAEEETFSEAIEVSIVNLEVFVTDGKGRPIHGLKREDFEVLEDGRPVEISNFYAESGAVPVAPGTAAAGAAARPEDQRLNLVLFIDDVNTEHQSRTPILMGLKQFLRNTLQPGDRAMLVRYTSSLDIRRPLTGDVAQLEADIDALKEISADIRNREGSRSHALEDIIDAIYTGDGWGPLAEGRIRAYAEQESAVVRGALDGLEAVVSWLAGVSGRKAILYVSDGLALTPGDDLYYWASARSNFRAGRRISGMGSQTFDLSKKFREVTSHASRNRVTIYPIEAAGIRTVRGTAVQEVLFQNLQNGLRFLADETGARPMLNAAKPAESLKLMTDDLGSFYSLGYQPARTGDDREHKIEVKVKARGANVRHRQWYKDKPVSEQVAERTLAVMRFGPEDNPLGATLEIGEQKAEGEGVLVPVRVKIPVGKLYLAAKEGARTASLRLFVVASGGGSTTPVRETRTVSLTIPQTELAAGKVRDYVQDVGMTLKPGTYSVGVGVRDEGGSITSYLRKDFEVALPNP